MSSKFDLKKLTRRAQAKAILKEIAKTPLPTGGKVASLPCVLVTSPFFGSSWLSSTGLQAEPSYIGHELCLLKAHASPTQELV